MITIAAAIAYLIGSISFAVIVSRVMGLDDPRNYGSKNPGATNVLRSGSKAAAVLTLLGDAFKGWVAVWLAKHFALQFDFGGATIAIVALAVFLGHLYPVFFRFKGGKGVATALGVLVGLEPWLGLAALATWLIIAVFFRYSSLAAIVAAVFAPLYYVFGHGAAWTADPRIGTAIGIMSLLLLYRHRKNIANLLAGKESRIGGVKGPSGGGR
ncbi:putative glycerol-3-phosphate acyltransferase [Pigmentiphaga humi]|uniref:Glycerol-3-phosphate acyltransferase n=1 Tax=Pigmentiphaga humi TaxID=2478468 RepID=A0A3P4B4N0_9BURK|nr:glycerol-3-phosphate 1-O-acyltransferase PlsY [Pigmentiphaga humi]VCU71254.1 putative glycerol-3-phosphate acyltransferase [Pigmentiphaga humi]